MGIAAAWQIHEAGNREGLLSVARKRALLELMEGKAV
jgi:hypothetical protein